MALLSLGLHNDAPPTSSHGVRNEVTPEHEGSFSAHESSQELDGFEADRFDEDVDTSEAEEKLTTWMGAAAEQLQRPTGPRNANESLPPGVEQLRRKLAEAERKRASWLAPAPLSASVNGLSSSERQWVP